METCVVRLISLQWPSSCFDHSRCSAALEDRELGRVAADCESRYEANEKNVIIGSEMRVARYGQRIGRLVDWNQFVRKIRFLPSDFPLLSSPLFSFWHQTTSRQCCSLSLALVSMASLRNFVMSCRSFAGLAKFAANEIELDQRVDLGRALRVGSQIRFAR